jgi:two-component system sensor histidine kinase KdpD
VLQRERPEDTASWVRIHTGTSGRSSTAATRYRVALVADGLEIGSLWSERAAVTDQPTIEETRLLAATADQVAQAVRRDRLAAAAADAEVERRSDELRSALLDSVSHDLRTPLAAIRAAAGSLADPAIVLGDDERRATARTIDEEAERLNRLVGSILDMSRIQSGALATDLEVTPLWELLDPIVERYRPRLAGRLTVHLPDDLPAVHVDQTFLSQALSNVIDNAATHASPEATVAIKADAVGADVEITVEDSGPGVAPDALPRLFDRFYRAPGASRHGVGLGLTVVRGLVEAMGGSVRAAASELGGLAVVIRVPTAPAERS